MLLIYHAGCMYPSFVPRGPSKSGPVGRGIVAASPCLRLLRFNEREQLWLRALPCQRSPSIYGSNEANLLSRAT